MTTTNQPNPSSELPEPHDLPDPRPAFATALDVAATVVAEVSPANVTGPTPASEYDVDQLTRHLVAVVERVAAVARGEDPFSVPQEIEPLAPHRYRGALDRARAGQEAAWADDGVLARPLTLPFAVLPGAIALSIYVSEITVHTWDLAVAIGADVAWDDDVVAAALLAITTGLPAEPRGVEVGVPFDPVVPSADDAPAIDRVVAWTGRDPAWRP